MGEEPIGQQHAFLIAGDSAAHIANDVCDFRYRARQRTVPPGMREPANVNLALETQILVDCGIIEIMVGGAATAIPAGSFVRVPPGAIFAWHNAGQSPASLLIHTVTPGQVCPTTSILAAGDSTTSQK
jgi:mannose-6-phosphate isomerase-like protein (cupin superfamily)